MKQPKKNRGIKRRPEDLRMIRLERELSIALQRIAELEKATMGTEYWFNAENRHKERLQR